MSAPLDRIVRLAAHRFSGAEVVWVRPEETVDAATLAAHEVAPLAAAVRRADRGVMVPDTRQLAPLEPLHGRLGALAGVPTDEGTLLFLFRQPRAFSEDDREALADFAALAATVEADRYGAHPPPGHELRTPLTNLLGFTDLLERIVDGEASEYVARIQTNARLLLDALPGKRETETAACPQPEPAEEAEEAEEAIA